MLSHLFCIIKWGYLDCMYAAILATYATAGAGAATSTTI